MRREREREREREKAGREKGESKKRNLAHLGKILQVLVIQLVLPLHHKFLSNFRCDLNGLFPFVRHTQPQLLR